MFSKLETILSQDASLVGMYKNAVYYICYLYIHADRALAQSLAS